MSIIAVKAGATISTYTWATRPNASLTTVGTIINVSDVGGTGGSLWKATAGGWIPLGGSLALYSGCGSRTTPLDTIASTGELFVPVGGAGSLVIPASMLIAGRSRIRIESAVERTGATGTATADTLSFYLGTAGTAVDSSLYAVNIADVTLTGPRPCIDVFVVSSSAITTTNYVSPGASTTANGFRDVTTNINTAAAMTVSVGMSAATATDTYALIALSVELVSI